MAQIVPLTSDPDQSLRISLSVDSGVVTLQLRVRFLEMAGYWVMTVSDQNGNVLIDSLPLVTGVYPAANLLRQYGYLRIGSAFLINASGVPADLPDATNLGQDFQLIWDDSAS